MAAAARMCPESLTGTEETFSQEAHALGVRSLFTAFVTGSPELDFAVAYLINRIVLISGLLAVYVTPRSCSRARALYDVRH